MATPPPLPAPFGPGSVEQFYARWLAAQPAYTGKPASVGVQNDGKPHQVLAPGGTPFIVSSVAIRNNLGNSGTLIIREGSGTGQIICTLGAGQNRSIFWVDPGSLWYTVTGGASTDAYEISWGA